MLDPYERPPDSLRDLYKRFQRLPLAELEKDGEAISLDHRVENAEQKGFRVVRTIDKSLIRLSSPGPESVNTGESNFAYVYESIVLPGV